MKVLSSEQLKRVEQKAVENGISWLRLMENAGSAAAKVIRDIDLTDKNVVIICGKGNNGGDGYVIARKLFENYVKVKIIVTDLPSTPSAKEMASKSYELGIRPVDFGGYPEICTKIISEADVIVDAIFGIGFSDEPKGIYKDIIDLINYSKAFKVSVDIPSGMVCDSGKVGCCFVKPDVTVSFTAYKPCLVLYPSSDYCKKTVVADIGIQKKIIEESDSVITVIDGEMISTLLPERSINCHKGSCGTASLFVGKKGFSGAAVISAKAAVLCGSGIVNAVIPDGIYNIVGTSVPEAVCTVLDGKCEERNGKNTEAAVNSFNKATAGLIGCGLGTTEHSKYTVYEILKNCSIPIIVDADGLNILSQSIECLRSYLGGKIITPHPKEAARILGTDVTDVQSDRLGSVKKLAEITGAVSVLKGAYTLVAMPGGEVFVCVDGNPSMATAGTGDMLAGMIAAFLAEGLPSRDASVLSVKLHADCGDRALKLSSLLSVTPSLMLNVLPEIIDEYYRKKVLS